MSLFTSESSGIKGKDGADGGSTEEAGRLYQEVIPINTNSSLDLAEDGNLVIVDTELGDVEVTLPDSSLLSKDVRYGIVRKEHLPFSFAGGIVGHEGNDFLVGEDEHPTNVVFNHDGTKMFVAGAHTDSIHEYDLDVAYSLAAGNVSYTGNFFLVEEDTFPADLAFNSDGTKLFVLGEVSETIYEYTLSEAYSLASVNPSVESFLIDEELSSGFTFNSDGSKLFVLVEGTKTIYEHVLNTPFSLASVSPSVASFFVNEDVAPADLAFNSDGTKLFVLGEGSKTIYEYTLSVAYSLVAGNINYTGSLFLVNEDTLPSGFTFNSDGTKLFVLGQGFDTIYEYIIVDSNKVIIKRSGTDRINGDAADFEISSAFSISDIVSHRSLGDWIGSSSINLNKASQIEYDNLQSGLNSTDVKGAVDEIATIAQLYGSSSVNGSADTHPINMTVDFSNPNLYDTTSATFVYIDTTNPLNHVRVVKNYTGETGRTLAKISLQRNVFMYMDVSQNPPAIVESLNAPEVELNMTENLVSIGNFDLVQGIEVGSEPFDTIQGVNTFVHASYSQNELSKMLHVTRGNFNVYGSEFGPAGDNVLLAITPGRGIRLGVNIQADYQHPDIISDEVGTINNVNMQYISPTGETITELRPGKDLVVDFYAPNGILTAMPSQKFQIMYLYKFYGSNSIRAHYGDEALNSIPDAEAVINPHGPTPQSDQTLEAQLRTALIVKKGTTELTNTDDAKFVQLV